MSKLDADAHYLMRGIATMCAEAEPPGQALDRTILKAMLLGIQMGLADPEISRRLKDASLMGDGALAASFGVDQIMARLRDFFRSPKGKGT